MKSFAFSAALLAATALANINDENSIIRYQTEDVLTPQAFTVSSMVYTMTFKSLFREDDGCQYLRIQHDLTADIPADKLVEFLFKFQATRDEIIDPVNRIYKDAAICQMIQNSQDTRFWTQTAKDGYYVCSSTDCNSVAETWQDDTSPSDLDWTIPIEDDDPSAPFCTPHSSDSATYACEAIKCIHERKFDTGYTDDFRFRPEKAADGLSYTAQDYIEFNTAGDISVGIHVIDTATGEADSTQLASTLNTDASPITVEIYVGAVEGLKLATAATAILVSALAF